MFRSAATALSPTARIKNAGDLKGKIFARTERPARLLAQMELKNTA